MDEYKFDGYRFDGVTSMMYHHHGLSYAFTGESTSAWGRLLGPMCAAVASAPFRAASSTVIWAMYPGSSCSMCRAVLAAAQLSCALLPAPILATVLPPSPLPSASHPDLLPPRPPLQEATTSTLA
jgi:hypothetical protein